MLRRTRVLGYAAAIAAAVLILAIVLGMLGLSGGRKASRWRGAIKDGALTLAAVMSQQQGERERHGDAIAPVVRLHA